MFINILKIIKLSVLKITVLRFGMMFFFLITILLIHFKRQTYIQYTPCVTNTKEREWLFWFDYSNKSKLFSIGLQIQKNTWFFFFGS